MGMVRYRQALHRPRVGGSTTERLKRRETRTGLHRPRAGGTTLESCPLHFAVIFKSRPPPTHGRWGVPPIDECIVFPQPARYALVSCRPLEYRRARGLAKANPIKIQLI